MKAEFTNIMRIVTLQKLILLTISGIFAVPTIAQEQQNVLFIAIDDLKTVGTLYSEEKDDFLQHIYPDNELRREVVSRMTPNIQRLADQSVTFMNAYSPSPACNPSRAALMTGIRPHESGFVRNERGIFFRDWEYEGEHPFANATTLPGLLKNNGWYTAQTGKIFHGTGVHGVDDFERADGNRSWTDWTYVKEDVEKYVKSRWNPSRLDWGSLGGPESTVNEHNDLLAADFIARVLENGKATNVDNTFELPEGKPFFLACGIYKPHLPFSTTQDMLNLFPVEEMTVTREMLEYFKNDAIDLPPLGLRYSGSDIDEDGDVVMGDDRFVDMLKHGLSIDPENGDLAGWKDMLKHYFACVATADRAVGRLVNGLENSPYADNTMVILWSDHGYQLGEKFHFSKFNFWDDASRAYFMVKDQRNLQAAGQRCYQPVSLMDIYPTVASMAGLELPDDRISGRDLLPLLKDPSSNWSVPAHTTFRTPDSHMIRDHRFKLIRHEGDDSEIELYDLKYDGEEYYNLANVPGYEPVLKRMRSLMEIAIQNGKFEGE